MCESPIKALDKVTASVRGPTGHRFVFMLFSKARHSTNRTSGDIPDKIFYQILPTIPNADFAPVCTSWGKSAWLVVTKICLCVRGTDPTRPQSIKHV